MRKGSPEYWLLVIGLVGLAIAILGSILDPKGKAFGGRGVYPPSQ